MSGYSFSRRTFLKQSTLAGGGLLLGMRLGEARLAAATPDTFTPNAFLRISSQGPVTLIVPHTEVGQGIYTSSAMLVAEELEIDLDQISLEAAPPDIKKYADPILRDQATGGSTSTRADWMRLREAGAAARVMLVKAAARRWGVDAESCRAARGIVLHPSTGRSLKYAEIAGEAARDTVPDVVPLKDPRDFRLIGRSVKRLDTPSKVNGTATYSIDVKMPGMAIGTLAIAPVKGGKIASLNEAAARRVVGVRDVIKADGVVAVVGDTMWAAKQGLTALDVSWEAGEHASVSTASLVAAMKTDAERAGVIARQEGDAARTIEGAAVKLSAIYESPFLSHAAMEPLSCTLHIQPDRAEIWLGTQVPVRAQKAVADATGLPIEKVVVNNLIMGGAFGRRLEIDSVAIAAEIAKQVDYPLKLVWTREQDMQHDYYRPYYYDRVSAGLDANGKLIGRTHRVTGPSLYARWAPGAFKNGLDIDAVDCAAETPYDEDAVLVDYVRHEPASINTSWWRGVGPTHNVFVVESFIDEMAAATKQDAVAFRRSMLKKNPRAVAVLDLATEKAGWGATLPPGTGRGVSLQSAFGSYLACVIDASVSASGNIDLLRAVVAVDCGMTVNPDTVVAQMEGGVIFGLTMAMYGEITITNGAVDQANFDSYRILRMNEVPKIEVYHIRNGELPGGVGEAGTAIVAGALGNAIFAATGRRIRKLPFATGALAPAQPG